MQVQCLNKHKTSLLSSNVDPTSCAHSISTQPAEAHNNRATSLSSLANHASFLSCYRQIVRVTFSTFFFFVSSLYSSLDYDLEVGDVPSSTACGLVSQTVVTWAHPSSWKAETQFGYGSGYFVLQLLNLKAYYGLELDLTIVFGDRETRMSWW